MCSLKRHFLTEIVVFLYEGYNYRSENRAYTIIYNNIFLNKVYCEK